MANYVRGTLINLFYHNGTSWVPFAYSTSHTLDVSSTESEVASKDHGNWADKSVQSQTFSFSCEALFTAENAKIALDMQKQAKKFSFCFAQVTETSFADGLKDVTGVGSQEAWTPGTAFVQYGDALITSCSVSAANSDVATISLTATGSGALSNTAPVSPISYTTE